MALSYPLDTPTTIGIESIELRAVNAVAVSQSPFTYKQQVVSHGGQKWEASLPTRQMSNPGSTLKKKSAAIAYHFVREGCVKDEWRTDYINTHDNVADLFTKALPSGEKRWKFVSKLLAYLAPKQFYKVP